MPLLFASPEHVKALVNMRILSQHGGGSQTDVSAFPPGRFWHYSAAIDPSSIKWHTVTVALVDEAHQSVWMRKISQLWGRHKKQGEPAHSLAFRLWENDLFPTHDSRHIATQRVTCAPTWTVHKGQWQWAVAKTVGPIPSDIFNTSLLAVSTTPLLVTYFWCRGHCQ